MKLPSRLIVPVFAVLIMIAPVAPAAAQEAEPVSGCGTITGNTSCPTFQLDGGGLYLLNDLGGFPQGTRAYIEGETGSPCNELCLFLIPVPCVLVKVIRLCEPPVEFEGCGTITGGEGCPTFRDDTDTIYFLSNLGGYEPGTRVRVSGTVGGTCETLCDLAAPCIQVATLALCSPRDTGDFDGSGCTDIGDFLWLLDHWSGGVEPPLGIADFLALLDNWQLGSACP